MAKNLISVDKVRASRDGHEFHEAWTARRAMQLLIPTDDLIGIAVEGLHPADQAAAALETVQIADIVLYYGKKPTFKGADTINIVQFKYSISSSDDDFRASHAKKTIVKFAAAYRDHKTRFGARDVRDKLGFELITNRPIYPAFEQAIANIAAGNPLSGLVKKQADQFKAACNLDGNSLVEFARKLHITGLAGSLIDNKRDLSRTLVDWSATSDAVAGTRLGAIRQMVHDKAGYAGTNRNVIGRIDVLAALDVPDVDELIPCPASLPKVGEVVERAQLADAIMLIPKLDKPLLVHANGGVGKTVFMNSLAQSLANKYDILFFDCFGGGAYRALDDSRHLPKRGLVHIINTLAFRGLCDPLLPDNNNTDTLFRTFRRRLSQCVKTLSTASEKRELILFIDAIDITAQHAKDRNEPSFPTLLLESFYHRGPVSGVKLVVSCRSYRIGMSMNGIPYTDFKLKSFNSTETETYLRDRIPSVTQIEIQVAQARSAGNARILKHLVTSNRGLLDKSEIDNSIKLDDLLNERIEAALSKAVTLGYKKTEINAFLAGLSILPPPVPLEEYASTLGMDISVIESFAADLAPLLERTKYGLIFRDEPTETLIRKIFGSDDNALRRVAKNLLDQQGSSVYAARALPNLLQKLDDGKRLFNLAFDERFPKLITSIVGKQSIRYARLKAAVLHAANKSDYNRLIHLLVELSTIAAVDQKGIDYILEYPDLVLAAQDVDATRRLFETRTKWPGTRHARLAIANTLSGDFDDANRHAVSAEEWILHYRQQDRKQSTEYVGPERLDIAAIPFCLITQNRAEKAIGFMRGWKYWYAYEVGEHLFRLLEQAEPAMLQSGFDLNEFLDMLSNDIGAIASTLSFLELDHTTRNQLIKKLSKACKNERKLETNDSFHVDANYNLQDGLLKASVIAASFGLEKEALIISSRIPHERPGISSFLGRYSDEYLFKFLSNAALTSAIKGKKLRERDILPRELFEICSGMRNAGSSAEFIKKLKKRLETRFRSKQDHSKKDRTISYELKRDAESFLDDQLVPLLTLTNAFAGFLGTPINKGDEAFLSFLKAWTETKTKRDRYSTEKFDHFFQLLESRFAVFALWSRSDLKTPSVKIFLEQSQEQKTLGASTLIMVITTLSKRNHLHELAGDQAVKVCSLIENEDDVDYRATLYARLGRAILPASKDEAAAYFKLGLEQMDAIGSGDFEFTNELLLFASSLRGDELAEQDFHTLTNICELNMSYDEEKFPWYAFAKGMSRTSGCKALAKLARWDDRSKISLHYTLLPYLTALIDDGKIAPKDAIALNRLSNPVELYACNTAEFAGKIDKKNPSNYEMLVHELIKQFEDNNPGIPTNTTVEALASIAEKALGKASETTIYLLAAHKQFAKVIDEGNKHMNYHGESDSRWSKRLVSTESQNRTKLKKLAIRTMPIDEVSLGKAIDELKKMQLIPYANVFFKNLRSNVPFSDRVKYIQLITQLENLNIYTKLKELEICKGEWGKSSEALTSTYKTLGIPIMQLYAQEFISYGQLSGYMLNEVSELSEVPFACLALELIKIFASADSYVPASVWLGLATGICDEANDGEGQIALKRLLKSNSAKLASNVTDGEWENGYYPANNITEIASGLVWRMLGSPRASDRWRAAHSMKCFAKFKRWKVIDALVARFPTEDALPFQAPELSFYYMHARLWLLITLSRIALDDPKIVAKYYKVFSEIALDEKSPHVLMRHFASRAILVTFESGYISLSAEREKQIRYIDHSPFPRLKKTLKDFQLESFYKSRPKGTSKPKSEFHLEYDFEKYDVNNLSDVFGKPNWEVKDLITAAVRDFDKDITSMYKSGGRETSYRRRIRGIPFNYHGYGEYLGWHALHIVAGKLLQQYPVTDDWHYDEPWEEWLDRRYLTRQDGLWLSDGMDRPPLELKINLLEKGRDNLVITGNKSKILSLFGIDSDGIQYVTVEGSWRSPDNIKVYIGSALVAPRKTTTIIKQLIQEEPFFAWLPTYDQYENEDEYIRNNNKDFIPWIVRPSKEGGLDKDDPLGATCAERRPRFAKNIVSDFSLVTTDPFGRIWKNSAHKPIAHADSWGYDSEYDEESDMGVRLMCSGEFMSDLLTNRNKDLCLFVKLQRYEKKYGHRDSRFSNTVAVVRIKKSLDFKLYMGAVNKIHRNRY